MKHRTEYEVESKDEGKSWMIRYVTQNVDHRNTESYHAPNQYNLITTNQTMHFEASIVMGFNLNNEIAFLFYVLLEM